MKKAIIIFTRIPIPGETKTRLQVLLTKEECADVHRAMIQDLIPLCECREWDVFVYYTSGKGGIQECGKAQINELLPGGRDYRPQPDTEFGERMYRCITDVLTEGYQAGLLIGSDIPGMRVQVIRQAFSLLEEKEVVIGATEDKGYYLIGMRQPIKSIFERQTYGRGNVFEETVEKIKQGGYSYGVLPSLLDIDEPEDLCTYLEECKMQPRQQETASWRCIRQLQEKYDRL